MFDPWPLADHPVIAWRGSAPVPRNQFLRDVACAQAALGRLGETQIVLFDSDSYRFAVWLIAGWRAGLAPVVPGDALPTTRQALPQAWVGDAADAQLTGWDEATDASPPIPPAATAALTIFTSGTTGQPIAISKTLAQLRNEVDVLETAFGARMPAHARIASSVPHQHLYGLLFRILWPLAAGRAFVADTLPWPESIWTLPAEVPHVLVASPAMLKRVAALAERPPLPASLPMVFSSGGPLDASANLQCRALLRSPVTEVYGSSETGGIAHRHHPDDAWTPQPGVQLRTDADDVLWLHSPFLPDDHWHATSDRARLENGQLQLLGRADRIVKIEEKRISLTQIEALLAAHPLVSAARALPLHRQRDEIAAVLVLSAEGVARLAEAGRAALDKTLRQALVGSLDPIALPRRWRFVAELPHNALGKTTDALLGALFAPAPAMPEVIALTRRPDGVTATLYIPADLVHFDGHFAAAPVLPGVVLVDWAIRYGREWLGVAGTFAQLQQLKFQRIIQPGAVVTLALDRDAGKRQLAFTCDAAQTRHASGRIRFNEVVS
ncbi:Acyl-coenzyme A synthetase/AMP-(fatty) acid ligase [Andreprevotia lacus DSM 23236]|uniref:Acyl-coenzyme A synthetase/AMP-(Fatty) acid ligase n=1 Tax=Andreprevotia lacus DSM 23236 TaxID=1121001 RepID=A0A1W1X3S5_9NEIS|nr:AMP-binding protein [Andreprevotia lacus]SMC18604.1 Acyl-coenzyme A synthetase/AMP-(fatty) acid ligase [Andreprevotia lacus DSM 23236]